ncbi:MAG: helix-turn-helix transcriptional regulator [Bacteroidales bacterium]|nr:helix-turn-helix transcriptional regulator [Bacteroidales bacterium]
MKQPELGKKILKLRLAKGLTQVELAEKCNLNLRTIQRIESSAVTPRSQTIKLIFCCLDYDIYGSSSKRSNILDKSARRIQIGLELLFKYFKELINLKKHTMKKVIFLVIAFMVLGFFLANAKNDAQQESSKIIGTWKIISNKVGNGETVMASESSPSLKLITQSHFTWIRYNADTQLIEGSAGGRYIFEGDSYIEILDFGSLEMKGYLGTKSTFKVLFDGNKMTISGNLSSGLKVEQVWEKVK